MTWSWASRFRLRQHVRQSLWAVPLLGTGAGALLAWVDLRLEGRVTLPHGWTYSESVAGGLLSAVAGAMIGLVGLVVTIGVLVVQMATGTLSPRFMRLWYRDRLQKVVLAALTATFTFSFAMLREIGSGTVPDLGVTLAGVAVIGDLFLLLLYLDRFVHTLRPVAVGAAMCDAGLAVVAQARSLPPERARASTEPLDLGALDLEVCASGAGAIQAVHATAVVSYASEHDLVCVLHHAVGDFVNEDSVLFHVHGTAPADAARHLRGQVAIGHERTIDQDPAFAVRIIVDIAIRALSPAVNDPTTATQMVNYLGPMLSAVGAQELSGRGLLLDNAGVARLAVPTRTWDGYLELALSEIRDYGRTSTQVCRRLRSMLTDLEGAVHPANRPSVRRQLTLLDRAVERAFADDDDRALALGVDCQGLGGAPPLGDLVRPG